MTSTNLLYIYVIIINVVTFFIYGLDKSRAKAGQWRIPEAQLIFLAVIGGSVGALAGMKVFHHKTRKPKFKIGVPGIKNRGIKKCKAKDNQIIIHFSSVPLF